MSATCHQSPTDLFFLIEIGLKMSNNVSHGGEIVKILLARQTCRTWQEANKSSLGLFNMIHVEASPY